MKYSIFVSKDAHCDIDETLDYISNRLFNKPAAASLLNKIEKAYETLCQNSLAYPQCNDERLSNYRKITINNYIIIYRIDDNKKIVYIIRLFYARRDWANLI